MRMVFVQTITDGNLEPAAPKSNFDRKESERTMEPEQEGAQLFERITFL
jgi:hypothetical protein